MSGDLQSHSVPTYETQLVDKSLKVNRVWYRFFQNISDVPLFVSSTVAHLPSLTAGQFVGARSFVTDATLATFLSVPVGGGLNKVPVVWNGTGWLIG